MVEGLRVVHNLQDYTLQSRTSSRIWSAGAGREFPTVDLVFMIISVEQRLIVGTSICSSKEGQ